MYRELKQTYAQVLPVVWAALMDAVHSHILRYDRSQNLLGSSYLIFRPKFVIAGRLRINNRYKMHCKKFITRPL